MVHFRWQKRPSCEDLLIELDKIISETPSVTLSSELYDHINSDKISKHHLVKFIKYHIDMKEMELTHDKQLHLTDDDNEAKT